MQNKISGQCHCGAVAFTVQLSDGLNSARRCNCSYCRMRGAVAVSAPLSGITLLRGKEKLTEYRFNTGTAVHFFCSVCGIYTFHQRRSNPQQYGGERGLSRGALAVRFCRGSGDERRPPPQRRRRRCGRLSALRSGGRLIILTVRARQILAI